MPTVEPAIKMWSRTGSNAEATDNFRKLKAAFTEGYQVVHSADAREVDIYSAQGLPYVGQPYPGTDFVLAKRGQIEKAGPILSIVIINYEGEVAPLTSSGGGGGPTFSPINNTPLIDWGNSTSTEEIEDDFDGLPLCNVVGDQVEGIKMMIVDQVVTIQRNFSTWNSYLQSRYVHATNSDTFLGWPPGTGKIVDLGANNVIGDTGNGYWKGHMKVQFRYPYRTTPERAWWARYLNEGFYEYFPEVQGPPDANGIYPSKRIRAVDENKQPVTKPVSLDEFGKKITKASDAIWIERKIYDSLPFSGLGFI